MGISPNGGMTGADIVVGWVKDGSVKITVSASVRTCVEQLVQQSKTIKQNQCSVLKWE